MRGLTKSGIAIAVFLVTFCGVLVAPAAAFEYTVDPARSELVVQLSKEGLMSAVAHNHVIRATDFSGTVNTGSTVEVAVTVSTDSLLCDEPAIRQKYGLTRAVSDADRAKIQATMESAKQMDIETYPTMEFRSTELIEEKENSYVLNGELTIHGVTKAVSFPLAVEREGKDFRGKASIPFKQSDFGIRPISMMFGMIRVQDEATLYVDILIMLTDVMAKP